MRLAQKELVQSATHAGAGAGLFGAAGLLAFFGVGSLITAAVAVLALVLPTWVAALIVGAALLAAAGVAALVSKRQVEEATPAAPRRPSKVSRRIQEVKDARHGRS